MIPLMHLGPVSGVLSEIPVDIDIWGFTDESCFFSLLLSIVAYIHVACIRHLMFILVSQMRLYFEG